MVDAERPEQGQNSTEAFKPKVPPAEWDPKKSYTLPEQYAPVCNQPVLTPGLHILLGSKGSGKTLHSLALHLDLLKQGVHTAYRYILEPRASGTRFLLNHDEWSHFYGTSASNLKGGVLLLDSMTYVVAMLPELRDLGEMLNVTYEKGLSPRDIQGCLLHNEIAGSAGTAVIGTLNSELFPVAGVLEGAVEGEIRILRPGVLRMRNRDTRTHFEYEISRRSYRTALRLLGYLKKGEQNVSSSYSIERV